LVRTGSSAVLALIIGCVYAPAGGAAHMRESVSARINVVAQAVINVCMLSLLKTLQLLKREQGVVGREMHDRLYRPHEYLLATALAQLPFDAAIAAVRCGLLLLSLFGSPSYAYFRTRRVLALWCMRAAGCSAPGARACSCWLCWAQYPPRWAWRCPHWRPPVTPLSPSARQ
jgi:hypothetical protein